MTTQSTIIIIKTATLSATGNIRAANIWSILVFLLFTGSRNTFYEMQDTN